MGAKVILVLEDHRKWGVMDKAFKVIRVQNSVKYYINTFLTEGQVENLCTNLFTEVHIMATKEK